MTMKKFQPPRDAAAFIQAKVLPEHRGIVTMLRKLMRECAPEAKEVITYGVLGWKGNKVFALISPTKKDITLAFYRGVEFKDKFKLLRGVGKVSRHVKIRDVKGVEKDVLCYYIRQAVEMDEPLLPSTGTDSLRCRTVSDSVPRHCG